MKIAIRKALISSNEPTWKSKPDVDHTTSRGSAGSRYASEASYGPGKISSSPQHRMSKPTDLNYYDVSWAPRLHHPWVLHRVSLRHDDRTLRGGPRTGRLCTGECGGGVQGCRAGYSDGLISLFEINEVGKNAHYPCSPMLKNSCRFLSLLWN